MGVSLIGICRPPNIGNDVIINQSQLVQRRISDRKVTGSRFDSRTGYALCIFRRKLYAYFHSRPSTQAVYPLWWASLTKDLQTEPKMRCSSFEHRLDVTGNEACLITKSCISTRLTKEFCCSFKSGCFSGKPFQIGKKKIGSHLERFKVQLLETLQSNRDHEGVKQQKLHCKGNLIHSCQQLTRISFVSGVTFVSLKAFVMISRSKCWSCANSKGVQTWADRFIRLVMTSDFFCWIWSSDIIPVNRFEQSFNLLRLPCQL